MKFRHELKQEISYIDMLALRQRLKAVMKNDSHATNGKYEIRSLYFDNLNDKALREKIDGVNIREKFRIRYYNGDTSLIKLEKKSKINGLCRKESVNLTVEQTKAIINGDYKWMAESEEVLIRELYLKMKQEGLRPKTIVDYIREPFVFEAGNVRITLDYDIRTGLNSTDFLNDSCITIPVANNPIILEIKWDEYLPDIIKDIIQLNAGRIGAFSKYAACRMYD
ncbi:MAG: polyphosphate polymerase domain-containing protein [Lachnospiraceae bacterium]|nr:polyphosphate polymerase domain-containing protein [Lachnospiraceae bacterium]